MRFLPDRTSLTLAVAACVSALLASSAGGEAPSDSQVHWQSCDRLRIEFAVDPNGPPVQEVELWSTGDGGETWERAKRETSGAKPIDFDVPEDGLYGFYIILRNEAGASSPAPRAGVSAHQWMGVDRHAPLVQVLEARVDPRFKLNREVHVRWRVEDDHLANRPVSLHYRGPQDKTYRLIADSLAPDGRFRWTVPSKLSGKITLKVSARDRAGNLGMAISDRLTIEPDAVATERPSAPPRRVLQKSFAPSVSSPTMQEVVELPSRPALTAANTYGEPDAGSQRTGTGTGAEARREYEQGAWHRLRGELELAAIRFERALQLDPRMLSARNELAGVLCLSGRYEEAEGQFELVLKEDESNAGALKGLALVQATRKQYRSARDTLGRLLLLQPNDAESWLYLGDVQLFCGDRIAAREAWRKSAQAIDSPPDVKQRAEKRLAVYTSDRLAGMPETP